MGKTNICVVEVVAWSCCVLGIMFKAQLCMGELTSLASHATIDDDQSHANSLNIAAKIKFSTKDVTRETYTKFMLVLLGALTEKKADRNGLIPILPNLPETDSKSYVNLEISNGIYTVTFGVYITNVYVVGYQVASQGNTIAYFFKSYQGKVNANTVFPNANRAEYLTFNGDYDSLGGRDNVPLGFQALNNAITTLFTTQPKGTTANSVRKALVVALQMFSESARFTNIRQLILNTIPYLPNGYYGEFIPDGLIQKYENTWGKISAAVQTAGDGVFVKPITLTYQSQQVVLQTVRQLLPIVSLLLPACNKQPKQTHVLFSTPLIRQQPSSVLPIRSTLEEDDVHFAEDYICELPADPTVRITGLNGLCVSLDRSSTSNGINLQQCNENKSEQLWTFRASDQTIRSGQSCLATNAKSGDTVTISNCNQANKQWDVLNDGSIILSKTKLSWTATPAKTSGANIYSLTVQNLYNGSSQAWYVSNITKLSVKSIVAYNGLCLTSSVAVAECKQNYKWAIYPDGTIRPQQNQQNCLKVISSSQKQQIVVESCNDGADERWLFQSDSTIYHLKSGLVLQVGDSGGKVAVSKPSTDEPRQIWFQVD